MRPVALYFSTDSTFCCLFFKSGVAVKLVKVASGCDTFCQAKCLHALLSNLIMLHYHMQFVLLTLVQKLAAEICSYLFIACQQGLLQLLLFCTVCLCFGFLKIFVVMSIS